MQRGCFRKHIRCHSSVRAKQQLLNHTSKAREDRFSDTNGHRGTAASAAVHWLKPVSLVTCVTSSLSASQRFLSSCSSHRPCLHRTPPSKYLVLRQLQRFREDSKTTSASRNSCFIFLSVCWLLTHFRGGFSSSTQDPQERAGWIATTFLQSSRLLPSGALFVCV